MRHDSAQGWNTLRPPSDWIKHTMWSLGYVRLPKTTQNCSDLNYRVLCLLCFHHYRYQKGWQVPLILESKTILLSTKGVASKIVNYGFQDQFTSILCMFLVINGWGWRWFMIFGQLVPHGKSSQMVGEFVDQKRGGLQNRSQDATSLTSATSCHVSCWWVLMWSTQCHGTYHFIIWGVP